MSAPTDDFALDVRVGQAAEPDAGRLPVTYTTGVGTCAAEYFAAARARTAATSGLADDLWDTPQIPTVALGKLTTGIADV